MTGKKGISLTKNLKASSIGQPLDFEHRYHMSFDNNKSSYSGVPPQWRKELSSTPTIRRSSSSKSFNNLANDSLMSENILKDNTPNTITIKPNSPTVYDAKDFVKKVNLPKFIHQNFNDLVFNVSMKQSFGSHFMFYCYELDKKNILAVKFLVVNDTTNLEHLKNEISFHHEEPNENIVHFVSAYTWESSVWFVFDDYNDITLFEVIKTQRRRPLDASFKKSLDQPAVSYIAHSVLKGLEYIHSKKYIHRNIKSENILVSSLGIIRIGEFGICAQINMGPIKNEICGTPYWMAPEIVSSVAYGSEVDIWSFGCLLIEMISLHHPMQDLNPEEVLIKLKKITKDDIFYDENIPKFGPFARPFLNCCFSIDRTLRASSSQLLIHPFLINKCSSEYIAAMIADQSLK